MDDYGNYPKLGFDYKKENLQGILQEIQKPDKWSEFSVDDALEFYVSALFEDETKSYTEGHVWFPNSVIPNEWSFINMWCSVYAGNFGLNSGCVKWVDSVRSTRSKPSGILKYEYDEVAFSIKSFLIDMIRELQRIKYGI